MNDAPPPPGDAAPPDPAVVARAVDRINKLLTIAQDDGATEGERAAARKQAQRMLDKHGLSTTTDAEGREVVDTGDHATFNGEGVVWTMVNEVFDAVAHWNASESRRRTDAEQRLADLRARKRAEREAKEALANARKKREQRS